MSLYTIAVKPNDYNTRLSEFVSQLFNALAQMVQRKDIQGAETLGIMLGAIFDWCISLLYAEKTANIGWLYCPNAQMGFYPYIKSCPHCGRKVAEKYGRGCKERRVRVALLSNMHPVAHYDEYLKGFEDALWTRESDIQERTGQTVSVDSDDLLPFYDMLFTLTQSWFRDERLKQAFSVETLFRALGGQQE